MTDPGTPNPANQPNQNSNDLPEWARKAISDANAGEAAKRVELRTKTEELTAANNKIAEIGAEKERVAAEKAAAELNLLKLSVALAAGVPGDKAAAFAERIKGASKEELENDAKTLAATLGTDFSNAPPAYDPSQGRGGSTSNTNDPQGDMSAFLREQFESLGIK